MKPPRLASVMALTWALFSGAHASAAAPADEAAGMTRPELERGAQEELDLLLASTAADGASRLEGIYVAIDADETDVSAMAGCDDDGDYVVVLSRAMLDVIANVAYASASDARRGTGLVQQYGLLLARAQAAGARPLPAPVARRRATHGDETDPSVAAEAHAFARDALAWVVAHELSHALAGDLVCPRPTVTHERDDDDWTEAEQASALLAAAARSHSHDFVGSDRFANESLLARGRDLGAPLALLDVLTTLGEARSGLPAPQAAWSYLAVHGTLRDRARSIRDARELAERSRATESPRSPLRIR